MSSGPLRVAFLVDRFPDLSVTFIIDQVVGLLERGHDVRVFAFQRGRLDRQHPVVTKWGLLGRTSYIGTEHRGWRRVVEAGACLLRHPGIIGELRAHHRTSHPEGALRLFRDLFALARFSASEDFDVVHCHFAPNGITAAVLRRAGRFLAPIVTTFHGYDMRAGEASRGECYALLRSEGDRFLSISGYNRRLLEDWAFPAERVEEHRVGISLKEFPFRGARARSDEEVRILCVANLVPVKGLTYLIDAMARVARDRDVPPLRLRVVGEGPERAALLERVTASSLSGSVELVGGLSRPRVLRELQEADLFVLPSLAEATPVALMEAQAVGLPVVATEVGAVDEVVDVGRSGNLVPPGDDEALAQALKELACRPGVWGQMGVAGRAHVERHYDLDRLVDQLEDVYRDVLASHAATTS